MNNELKEYYQLRIFEAGMPEFEDLQHWQRAQMVNNGDFARWKARRSFENLRDSIFRFFLIPQIVEFIGNLIPEKRGK